MLAVLLWITLAASILLLAAVAAPIRVSCKAVYTEEGSDTELNAAACYLHPAILRAEYSSADEQVKFFILGSERKSGGGKDDKDDQDIRAEDTGANSINADDTDTEDLDIGSIDIEDIDADSINIDDADTKENIDAAGNDTDSNPDTDAKEEKPFSLSKIKSTIGDIKRNRFYKIISNKPMRKKLLRWLKRSFSHVTRAVSFEKFKLHARIGLQDPATLGRIYGCVSAAQSALTPRRYNIDLSIEPIFTEKRLDIDLELRIKTTLSIILWQLIMIAATFPYLRVRKTLKSKACLN